MTIPVTILTGFLGSGKTTLLSRALRDPRFSDTAVVINEFGEVGLDHLLVEHSQEAIVQMDSGCLCCTVRGDLHRTLLGLQSRAEKGEIPAFSRLVVETTGLADPAPVMHTLMLDPWISRRFRLGSIVTTLDAINGAGTLAQHVESVKQLAVADRIVVTKSDLAADEDARARRAALLHEAKRLNPGALIVDAKSEAFDLRAMFSGSFYDVARKGAEVGQWLNDEAYQDEHHAHHHHDVNRHSADIQAYCVVREEPLSVFAFTMAMDILTANRGDDLLRVKGILNIREKPGRPVVVHGVQHLLHEPVWLDAWPSDDHRSRIVFITRRIPKAWVEQLFDSLDKASAEDAGTGAPTP